MSFICRVSDVVLKVSDGPHIRGRSVICSPSGRGKTVAYIVYTFVRGP